MSQLRQAAQQALVALIDAANVLSAPMFTDAVAALRTALAQEHAMHNLARLGQEIEQEPLGSIALARSLCYQINGAADDSDDIDGGGYGSVDIAEILSAEVVRLQKALAQPQQQAEPTCPECKAKVLFECVACSSNNYPPQRPWQGLTNEDWEQIHDKKDTALDTFQQGAVWAADQLKERNT